MPKSSHTTLAGVEITDTTTTAWASGQVGTVHYSCWFSTSIYVIVVGWSVPAVAVRARVAGPPGGTVPADPDMVSVAGGATDTGTG